MIGITPGLDVIRKALSIKLDAAWNSWFAG